MGLQVLCRIKLPYIIRLSEPVVYTLALNECDEFSLFKISFHPNIDTLENEFFNPQIPDYACTYFEVQALLKSFDHERYELQSGPPYAVCNIPDDDTLLIFKKIKYKLNDVFLYLQYTTKMFWIEKPPINPISGVIGTRTDFAFLPPGETIFGKSRRWTTILDNYMSDLDSKGFRPLNNKLLDRYNNGYLVNHICFDYLFKASKSLYESEYENFVIYCAISAESFIKQFTALYDSTEDKVLRKLKENKGNTIETYYKVILKYLFGENLLDIDEGLYNNLLIIYRLRNELMHSGSLNEKSFKKVGIHDLDFDTCILIIKRLEKAITSILPLMGKKRPNLDL